MNELFKPLLNDEYTGDAPSKRLLAYLQSKRNKGKRIIGVYCSYAPVELIRAFDLIPATLCAFSNATIDAAETVLPTNLCPLIKSSYGFIIKDSCPFFGLSEAVVGETTCDGKKKMFELISGYKPLHVMDLPQMPDEPEAIESWSTMISKFKRFLEDFSGQTATDEVIEAAIRDSNAKARHINMIFDYLALSPPVLGWEELYDVLLLAQGASGHDLAPIFNEIHIKLDKRKRHGYIHGGKDAPRVMVTGCPLGGDAFKILRAIGDAGGVIVALEACSFMKPYMFYIEEATGDPIRALASHYLKIPCACMTPNIHRLECIDAFIERFRPDVVVDVVLQACHGYNIESFKLGEHINKKYRLPFLKIETDFSQGDAGQIRTRIEALLEMCN